MSDCDRIERGRVRIWDKNWNCLVDEHAEAGDTPSDVVKKALSRLSSEEEQAS